jgi:hypothetical protein
MHPEHSDAIIIYNPQVLPLIDCHEKKQPWIWQYHIFVCSFITVKKASGKNIII